MEKITKYKIGLIIAVIMIAGLLFYFILLPKHNLKFFEMGYNQALNNLALNKAYPYFSDEGNETIIKTIKICIPEFQQNYQNFCSP